MEETMNRRRFRVAVVGLVVVGTFAAPAVMARGGETLTAKGQEVEVPVPTEPGLFTVKGGFARIA